MVLKLWEYFLSYVVSFTGAANSAWMTSFRKQAQISFECRTHESCAVPARMTDGSVSNQANSKDAALNLMQDSGEG